MTAQFGFGPKGPRAALVRPDEPEDVYGQQTWFKDASAKGAKDGTVLNAAWLNARIGEMLHLAQVSGVAPPGNNSDDTFLTAAINALIRIRLTQALLADEIIDTLDDKLGDGWRAAPYTPSDIIDLIDGHLGGSGWRDFSQANIDAAMAQLRNGVGVARDTLKELSDALDGLSGAVVNDLVTGGTGVPLSAQQGVVLKNISDGLVAGLAAEIANRAAAVSGEASARATNDAAILAVANALVSLSGMASGAVDLGTFTGSTIPDNVSVKAALQALETKAEASVSVTEASQAEAEAATSGVVYLTPRRGKNLVDYRIASQAEAQALTDAAKLITPLRAKDAILRMGGRQLLATYTAATSAWIGDTAILATPGFSRFIIEVAGIVPDSTNQTLLAQIYSGDSWITTGYNSHGQGTAAQSTTPVVNGNTSGVPLLMPAYHLTSGLGVFGEIDIRNPASTTAKKPIMFQGFFFNPTYSGEYRCASWWGGGVGAITGIRLIEVGGNIASGTMKVFGLE